MAGGAREYKPAFTNSLLGWCGRWVIMFFCVIRFETRDAVADRLEVEVEARVRRGGKK